MSIKYSELTGEQVCYIRDGVLYVTGLDESVLTRSIGYIASFSSSSSIELDKGLFLAVCENSLARFILYHDFTFNIVRLSDGLLLDFGSIEPFRTVYTFTFIGSAWYKGSYKGVFLERSISKCYLSDNVHVEYSSQYPASELVQIGQCDEAYCLGLCRNYQGYAICGNRQTTYCLNIRSGEVTLT